jgi:uncharacterized protein YkwD
MKGKDTVIIVLIAGILINTWSILHHTAMASTIKYQYLKSEKQVPKDSIATTEQIENQIFEKVNAYRKSKNLSELAINAIMVKLARKHSKDMADGKVSFGHDGFSERMARIRKKIKNVSMGGENVYECSGNYDDLANEAFTGWLQSRGHKQNIEGQFDLTGIGVVKSPEGDYYFTQIFAKN